MRLGLATSPGPLLERELRRPESPGLRSQAWHIPVRSARLASVVLTGSGYLPDTRALETTGFFSPSPVFARAVGPNETSHHGIQDFVLSPANITFQVKTRSIHPQPRSCRGRRRLGCGQPPPVARPAPARTQRRDAPCSDTAPGRSLLCTPFNSPHPTVPSSPGRVGRVSPRLDWVSALNPEVAFGFWFQRSIFYRNFYNNLFPK